MALPHSAIPSQRANFEQELINRWTGKSSLHLYLSGNSLIDTAHPYLRLALRENELCLVDALTHMYRTIIAR